MGKTLNINSHTPSVDSIRELAVNCNGTKVIVLTSQVDRQDIVLQVVVFIVFDSI
jgi:hypothetical protein